MAAFAGLVEPAASQRGGARYAGSTSQGEGVTLHVSRSARTVTTLEARLVAFCRDRRPDRGVYQLAGIGIRGGAFAARQRLGSLAGARALLSVTGTFVRRGRVRGELDLLLRRPADEERVATRCRAHVSFTAQLPRSARTRFGALHQLQGPGSCFASRPQRGGCMIDPLFAETGGTSDLAISPDGRHVYAALGGPAEQDDAGAHLRSAVVVFVRNPATGRLHRLTGAAGCLREKGGEGCASARALRTVDAIEVSNDGRHIYVASGDGIAVLRRDPSTGALAQAPGPEGCVSFRNLPGCGAIRSWDSPFPFSSGFALGPRGHYAYLLGNGSLAVFTRARTTGALTQLADEAGCVRPKPADGCALGPSMRLFDTITVSPDGRHLYRMSTLEAPELQLLRRERGLRVLRAVRSRGGCFSDGGVMGCVPLRGVSYINDGAWSPDGRNLYGVSADEGIAIFARNGRTGGLRQLPGAAGCVVEAPDAGCGSARGVEGGGYPAVSPDGRNLYVNGGFSLAAFARDRRTGELLQLPGRAGCIADSLNDDYGRCAHPAQRNWGTEAMEVSPDGHHLYAIVGGFLTVYARRTQP
jgi:hypothetical protein